MGEFFVFTQRNQKISNNLTYLLLHFTLQYSLHSAVIAPELLSLSTRRISFPTASVSYHLICGLFSAD